MTKQTHRQRTFTRSNFAEHNYNYVHPSKTIHPPRIQKQNHLFSQKSNFPMTSTNSVNFHDYPQPSQDHSEIIHFFNKIGINNKHHITHETIYHQTLTIIINQIFLHQTQKNFVHKNLDKIKFLKI